MARSPTKGARGKGAAKTRGTKSGPKGRAGARPPPAGGAAASGSAEVAAWLRDVDDWRGETLARLRSIIREAVPDVQEDVKWRKPTNPAGVPVWSFEGLLATGEVYKDRVKVTFAQGAALKDPKKLFNASLTAGTRRAWDLYEGDAVDEAAFRDLVREAAARNAKMRAGK